MIKGRKEPMEIEKEFWERFDELLIDDQEDKLNELIGILRNTAERYFRWLKKK